MKKIKFTCTNCHAKLRVPTHLAGISAPCPKCGVTITAPSEITEAVEDDEPRRAAVPVSSSSAAAIRSQQEASTALEAPSSASGAALPVAKTDPLVVPVGPAPTPNPSVPKVTASVEVASPASPASPASRPLPPRAVAAESDHAADAPLSLPDGDEVVAEVSSVTVPEPLPVPPASVITQPIRVNSRPNSLPEIRSDVSGSDALPRLDVSLAGQDLTSAAAVLFAENAGQPVRTRVQLPQPGVETHKFSPDDFIVPPTAQEEVSPAFDAFDPSVVPGTDEFDEALPARYLSIPLPGAFDPIPLDALDDASYDEQPEFDDNEGLTFYPGPDADEADNYFTDLAGDDEIPTGLEAPAWSAEELAGEIDPVDRIEVPWNLEPASVHDDADFLADDAPAIQLPALESKSAESFEDRYDEVPVNSLHEGSFGKLFSQQRATGGEMSPPVSAAPAFPAESSAHVLPAAATEGAAQPEGDVLEELFGGSLRSPEDPKKLSKTAVVMISCLVGAAVIAILMVVLLGQLFLGGREPEDTYKEGSVVESAAAGKSKSEARAATIAADLPAIDEAPAVIDPVAIARDSSNSATDGATATERPALSIDERVQQIVNGTGVAPGTTGSVNGQTSLDLVDDSVSRVGTTPAPVETPALVGATSAAAAPTAPAVSALAAAKSPLAGPAEEGSPAASSTGSLEAAGKSANYNPPASFAAPGPDESPLLRVNDLIDAFLRAPDWQARIKYTYQGGSLQPAIENYYKKWPDARIDRFSLQLFQMEQSTELGGPYWVYLISTSDADQGFPLIIRVEEGNLKVDWEIFSEFNDRHFVRFRDGTMPRPSTFRVVIERVSDYYGTDREAFTNVKDYYVYQINPPYGDLNEFSEYAFVKKDSEVAAKLEKVVGLGEEPLAVIVTLDEKAFEHGVKHFVISDYLTEGWFR